MIEQWMAGYLKAWASDDPGDIAVLFTEDARYFTAPYLKGWRGRDEIVRQWIAHGDSGTRWSFKHEVLVDSPEVAVVRGVTTYAPDDPYDMPKVYHNLWVVRVAPDGKATEFTEWWMKEKP